jgi:hypothetical protein
MVLKLEFYGKIFEKYAILHVMQIRPVGDELFRKDGRTDRHDEANSTLFAVL